MSANTSFLQRLILRYPVAKSLAAYTAALYSGQALLMIRGFVLAYLLGPATFGLWRIVKLILFYLPQLAGAGIQAMRRELPEAIGQKDCQKSKAIIENVYAFSITMALGISLLCLSAIFWGHYVLPEVPRWLWITLALILPLRMIYDFYIAKFQTQEKVKSYSIATFIHAVLIVFFMISGTLFYGLKGAITGLLLSYILLFAWMTTHYGPILFRGIDLKAWCKLYGTGFPIWLNLSAIMLLKDIDQVMIAIFRGSSALGYYSIAIFFGALLQFIPFVFRQVLQPRLVKHITKSKDHENAKIYFEYSLLFLSYTAPLAIAALFYAISPAISIALHDYYQSIETAQIYVISSFWRMIVPVSFMICIAIDKRRAWIKNTSVAIGVHLVLTGSLLALGKPLEWIAASTGLVYFFYTLIQIRMVTILFKGKSAWLSFTTKAILPFVTLVLLLSALKEGTLLNITICLLVLSLQFYGANKRWHFLDILQEKV